MSVSSQMKELREMLGVENNTEAKDAVQVLQQRPVILSVTWVPGQPPESAVINVLTGGDVPFHVLGATLRAGLAVLDIAQAQRMMQMQAQLKAKEPEA